MFYYRNFIIILCKYTNNSIFSIVAGAESEESKNINKLIELTKVLDTNLVERKTLMRLRLNNDWKHSRSFIGHFGD